MVEMIVGVTLNVTPFRVSRKPGDVNRSRAGAGLSR
jgi:hypothetical protein